MNIPVSLSYSSGIRKSSNIEIKNGIFQFVFFPSNFFFTPNSMELNRANYGYKTNDHVTRRFSEIGQTLLVLAQEDIDEHKVGQNMENNIEYDKSKEVDPGLPFENMGNLSKKIKRYDGRDQGYIEKQTRCRVPRTSDQGFQTVNNFCSGIFYRKRNERNLVEKT